VGQLTPFFHSQSKGPDVAKSQAEFRGANAGDVAIVDDPIVRVRVLEAGDGKISTGNHTNRGGEELYEYEDQFDCLKSIADGLRARHYVEIVKKAAEKAA